MKRSLLLAALLLVTIFSAGCQKSTTGVLSGEVSVGPLQPVLREGEVEPTPPPEVFTSRGINIFKSDGITLFKEVMFSDQGDFSIELPVGTYVINLIPNGIDYSKDLPAEVEIRENETTTLNIDIDTGIR